MSTRLLAAALSVAMTATAATAAQTSETKVAADEKKPDPDAVTCKYVNHVSSRIPVRICRTNFEWEAERQAQLEERRSSRRSASKCADAGPC